MNLSTYFIGYNKIILAMAEAILDLIGGAVDIPYKINKIQR